MNSSLKNIIQGKHILSHLLYLPDFKIDVVEYIDLTIFQNNKPITYLTEI